MLMNTNKRRYNESTYHLDIIKFYQSIAWRNKRIRILKRDNYMCQECKRYGRTREAQVVHHVFPLRDYPEYRLLNNNLYSCCNACHNRFHNRDNDELTSEGLNLLERLREKIVNPPCS